MDLRTKGQRLGDYIKENMRSRQYQAIHNNTLTCSRWYYLTVKGVEYSVGVHESFDTEDNEIEYVVNEFKNEICSRLIFIN